MITDRQVPAPRARAARVATVAWRDSPRHGRDGEAGVRDVERLEGAKVGGHHHPRSAARQPLEHLAPR